MQTVPKDGPFKLIFLSLSAACEIKKTPKEIIGPIYLQFPLIIPTLIPTFYLKQPQTLWSFASASPAYVYEIDKIWLLNSKIKILLFQKMPNYKALKTCCHYAVLLGSQ